MKKTIQNMLILLSSILFISLILALSIRGIAGNPSEKDINEAKWKEAGPLELSPDRSRFALMFSLVENGSFQFSLPIARMATPDVAYNNGKYVSLFAPSLSFLIAPGYIIGKYFGIGQVGSFAIISLFSIINFFLIKNIAKMIGASSIAATIGAFVFLFATPAFAYAVSLYQHHISTFLVLFSIYSLLRWKSLWSVALVWALTAFSISVDNPNFVFMTPIVIWALSRMFSQDTSENKVNLQFKLLGILTFFAAIIPLAFFLWFNQMSHGNALKLSGTLPAVKVIDESGRPGIPTQDIGNKEREERFLNPQKQKKSASGFFKTRSLLNGFYIHFISPDRGILYYAPIIFLAIIGVPLLLKQHPSLLALFLSIIGGNILLYSMWGDPWGGWAFGSRYLIPSFAVLSILIAIVLEYFKRNIAIMALVLILFVYSAMVNTLGAITTNANPPKGEAKALEPISGRIEKYSFDRNIDYLINSGSKSYVFQTFANRYLTAFGYYLIVALSIITVFTSLVIYLKFSKKEQNNDRV